MLLSLIALIVAITIHEFSHAKTADYLGDPTPGLQGRLTLNPRAHLDLYGSLIFVFLLITDSPIIFGWGKPVVFDPFNLRHPRRDAALISLAGPVSNLSFALVCSIILRLTFLLGPMSMFISIFLAPLLQSLIMVNVVLAIFNLIPIHPLDGFKIVEGILPKEQALEWQQLERFGYIFLILLIFPFFGNTAPLNLLISPIIQVILKLLVPMAPLV